MAQYGQTDWDLVGNENKNKDFKKDMYLRLQDGPNRIRIVTKPFQYLAHTYKKEGDKAKRRWLVGVIDRKTSTFKILDIGYSVFQNIKSLTNDPDWGDPSNYDIDLVVDRNGGASGYYKTNPKPAKPLSVADLELIEAIDYDDLNRRVTPPTADKVLDRLAKINGLPVLGERVS